jgi:hypothetical protein
MNKVMDGVEFEVLIAVRMTFLFSLECETV